MASKYIYHQTIGHNGLNKTKTIGANSRRELEYKVSLQYAQWEEQWARKKEANRKREETQRKKQLRERVAADNERASLMAKQQTMEAEKAQLDLDNLLVDRADGIIIDIESLKHKGDYTEKMPFKPVLSVYREEPKIEDAEFNPKMSFFTKISKNKKQAFCKENQRKFNEKHIEWEANCQEVDSANKIVLDQYDQEVKEWEQRKEEFIKEQEEFNQGIDSFKQSLLNGNPDAIVEMAELIFDTIDLPFEEFETHFDIGYTSENRNMIIDAYFPTVEDMPSLKTVSYVKSKQEFKESYYSEAQIKKKYDNVVYQMALTFLKYGFCLNQYGDFVDAIVINGIINTTDKATGNEIKVYVLSVRSDKAQFDNLNLKTLDPKAWFRSAKGIAAASVANVTPVQPVQVLDKEDHRFIEGYDVLENVDAGVNLAAIDWKDFENLIREIFEEEFSSNGGEVKVTQASRDGGVDAVCFDPDPIRGGKIVIQAKRYTNVVGVSAVRDLYGTILNEGAMKGILVTTSYFGNDAFEFANGKPIQLIDGGQLLGLLEKHGHKAKIDLREAKRILNANNHG